jgi:hypothetical protein
MREVFVRAVPRARAEVSISPSENGGYVVYAPTMKRVFAAEADFLTTRYDDGQWVLYEVVRR